MEGSGDILRMGPYAIIMLLLFFSAFFSSSETSFFSLDDLSLKKISKKKTRKTVKTLLKDSSGLLIAILLGNTAVNVALSSILEKQLSLESTLYSTIIVTTIILFFGEIMPKTIAISSPESMASLNSVMLKVIYSIFKPLVYPFRFISNIMVKKLNKASKKDFEEYKDEKSLSALLSIVSRGAFLDTEEKKLVESVLKFASREVWNIMTPRSRVISIEDNVSLSEAVKIFKDSGYSKLPVYKERDDNIVGVLYLRDVFPYIHSGVSGKYVYQFMEKIHYVPENKKLSEMLSYFQEEHIRIVAVVDEYGSSVGIVTIADVLGEIVGEIVDESFSLTNKIMQVNKNRFLISGDLGLDDFNEYFDTNLSSEEYETIAGYVIENAGDIPKEGFSVSIDKYVLTVKEIKGNYIDKIILDKR